ncbi:non-ribosomal peptide synthetase [Micromonospora tulbaghiae]|uniref:non-ribosomal peptide synthetase n=1 Tax=Micromonospora tulbaghiae TaxID=479978 RepID=UPI0029C37818|nr:non-ribosomal peptide synthetase [Micromonospora tulbaghiae]MDX5461799.1 non-ribosomal peptide synthetase [Micromonospora tulbaghiae]
MRTTDARPTPAAPVRAAGPATGNFARPLPPATVRALRDAATAAAAGEDEVLAAATAIVQFALRHPGELVLSGPAGRRTVPVDLAEPPTVPDLLDRIRAAAVDTPDGAPAPDPLVCWSPAPAGDGPVRAGTAAALRIAGRPATAVHVHAEDLDRRAAELFAQRLHTVLTRIPDAVAAGRPVTHVVGDEELAWIRRRLTGDRLDDPPAEPCHLAVLRHGAENPDARAIVDGPAVRTYGALRADMLRYAAALRGHLPAAATQPIVGVLADDLTSFLTGALAAMTAGAAFLPLDPALPPERIRTLVHRAGASVVLTGPGTDRSALTDVPVLPLDAPAPPGPSPVPAGGPGDLAYVLFTSGSTGTPKAVAVEHGQLSAYARSVAALLSLGPGVTTASPAGIGADLGYTATFPTLAHGGTVAAVPADARLDAGRFAAHLRAAGVDLVKMAPSHLAALLADPQGPGCLPARTLVLGGERLDPALLERLHALRPELRVYNHYGPTETTVGAFAGAAPARPGRDVSLGAPLSHVWAELRDPDGGPTPVGVPGRLFIGGAGVARGYLGDDEQTGQRFQSVAHPPGRPDLTGGRVYDTGDVCVLTPAGDLVFVGRADDQVKIRGFRVEPREVERTLLDQPGVRQACVLAEERHGESVLVGYVVHDGQPDPAALVDRLRTQLPEAWVPARLVPVAELPLLPNGKVDRARLRATGTDTPADAGTAAPAPADDVTAVLAMVWADLLGVARVDADADVFDLGAHSLTVTRAMGVLRDLLRIDVDTALFFSRPTVRLFAEALLAGPAADRLRRRATVVREVLELADAA